MGDVVNFERKLSRLLFRVSVKEGITTVQALQQ